MNKLKKAAKRCWWYKLSIRVKKFFTIPYTWDEAVEDFKKEFLEEENGSL